MTDQPEQAMNDLRRDIRKLTLICNTLLDFTEIEALYEAVKAINEAEPEPALLPIEEVAGHLVEFRKKLICTVEKAAGLNSRKDSDS